jgi:hypothetical protein
MIMEECYVEIFQYADQDGNPLEKSKIEKRMGPLSKHRAERVRNGAEINLNHDMYAVRIVHKERKP